MSEILVSVGPINVSKVGVKFRKTVNDEMLKSAEKALKKAVGFKPVPLPRLKEKGKANHNLSGSITLFSAADGKVSMHVSMVIAKMPEKSMYGFAKSNATVTGGSSERDMTLAAGDCAVALMEGFVSKALRQIKARR